LRQAEKKTGSTPFTEKNIALIFIVTIQYPKFKFPLEGP
jgi:hypothetical protein